VRHNDNVNEATASSPDKITAMLNQVKPGTNFASSYMAIAAPGKTIYLPLWFKQSGWISGLSVYNPNNTTANVTVRYYNPDGSLHSSSGNQAMAAHSIAIFYNTPSASTFNGSALVISDQSVTAVVNHSLDSSSGDGLMTYEGMHY
jgi:hypothetical protein